MKGAIRLVRGSAALVVLAGVIVGAPLVLSRIGVWPRMDAFPEILLRPDNGSVLVWALTSMGWVAWGTFTLSVAIELVNLLRGRRLPVRIFGLTGPRGPAALLLAAIIGMLPVNAHAEPAGAAPAATPSATFAATAPPATNAQSQDHHPEMGQGDASSPVDAADGGLRYTVQRGDDLWTLAEKFYGDGLAWSRIVSANPMISSPDVLHVGWELVLPGATEPAESPLAAASAATAIPPDAAAPEEEAHQPTHAEEPSSPMTESSDPAAARTAPVPRPAGQPSTGTERASADGSLPADVAPAERIAYATAGVSSLAAAALLATLVTRRSIQLQNRAEGRRIFHPTAAGLGFESALGQAQDPVSLRILDLALRALGRHYRDTGETLPVLRSVIVDDDGILLEVDRLPADVPVGFRLEGASLRVAVADHDLLTSRAGSLLSEPSPYPALVCIGETPRGELHLHDLESSGVLVLDGPRDLQVGLLNALLLELSCSWWGRGQSVIAVNADAQLAESLDDPSIHVTDDLDAALADLRAERSLRHPVRSGDHPRDLRIRPELEDAWRPHVLLVGQQPTEAQREALEDLRADGQLIAVVADGALPGPTFVLGDPLSRLSGQSPVHAQIMSQRSRDQLVELLTATNSTSTTPASWWAESAGVGAESAEMEDAGVEPVRAFPPEDLPARAHVPAVVTRGPESGRGIIVSLAARRVATNSEEPAVDAHEPVLHPQTEDQPTVLLVGPIDLVGTRGERPSRAARQCMEYAAWLLEHPGATATMMATELFVAEGTRRSNMSRLRAWLGAKDDGERFLPEAYSGRIHLDPAVTSVWNRMQLLTIGGVNRAADENLRAVLHLVRGAPLADAAPGQWHWAEELRTDISSLVRDVGLVLGSRALERGDVDLARWAVNRALVAAPEDERLLVMRVRTEHRAGNRCEVERLALRLVRTARKLNIDLAEETVTLLQEVVEGGPRQRSG